MKKMILAVMVYVFCAGFSLFAQTNKYLPSWESLDKRPNPAWYKEAKFGIFIHWGVYSVPSWSAKGTYSEWYWNALDDKEGETWKFHTKTYGESFLYQDFAPMFRAELFDPDLWADVFKKSGAGYVVLTSKHHDGFCLWPSPDSWNWNSMDIGPHRDLVGELTKAVREEGLKMGLYYSLYEWYHPLYKTDMNRYVDEHMLPQIKHLVENYQPSLIFTDGEWDHPSPVWKSTEFLAWLFNDSACREEVVINDRWGKECRGVHGGYYTTEYGNIYDEMSEKFKNRGWEECRGIGASFGYNRNEDIQDYNSAAELIHLLVQIVAKGGNLLLDIGPTADGRIPVIMQERLLQIGDWLKINGEAIYGSIPYARSYEGEDIWFTKSKDGRFVYAVSLKWPGENLFLEKLSAKKNSRITMPGYNKDLEWHQDENGLSIRTPADIQDIIQMPGSAYVFKMELEPRKFIDTPVISPAGGRVKFPADIKISTKMPDTDIYYTLDGSEPNRQSLKYDGTLVLSNPTMIRTKAFKKGFISSDLSKADFISIENGLRYKYYEGSWEFIPDFDSMKPVKKGIVDYFNFTPAQQEDYYGFVYNGFIDIKKAGDYTFYTISDDGSRLFVNNKKIVDNDGKHGRIEKSGTIRLNAGFHALECHFFEDKVGQDLEVWYKGPGVEKQPIPASGIFIDKKDR